MDLRDYQQQAVDDVLNAFEKYDRVMLQMPTGTGKTEVFCEIIDHLPNRKLVLVHRRELVDQIKKRLQLRCGINASIILAGHQNDYNPDYQVQIANIPTLIRRKLTDYPKNISLIVIDEAHHAKARTYQTIIEHYRNKGVKILGVTATPCRLNGTGFSESFDILIKSWSIKKFIKEGYLANFKHWATSSLTLDLSHVAINQITKDYNEHDLALVMMQERVMSDLIESYRKYGEKKQSIIFAVNKAHSEKIAERFNAEGFIAKSITCDTCRDDRDLIIEKYKEGKIQILSNVAVFTEGFDCPLIRVAQLARPTKSLTLYLQMVGRALRPNPDGSNAVILDNAKLWKTHGLITREHEWTLDGVDRNVQNIAEINEREGECEREDEIMYEVKELDMEQVDEILTTSLLITIHLVAKNIVIYEESIKLKRFPDPNMQISGRLAQLKTEYCFDTVAIFAKGVFILKEVSLKKKWSNWKKDGFEYQLIQNETIKNQNRLSQDYSSDIDNSIVPLSYCCRELFYLVFIQYILVDVCGLNHFSFFENIEVGKKFYINLKSPYFNIDFSKLGIEFPYKEYKRIRASINKDDFSFKDVLSKFNTLNNIYHEIKSWLDIIG